MSDAGGEGPWALPGGVVLGEIRWAWHLDWWRDTVEGKRKLLV